MVAAAMSTTPNPKVSSRGANFQNPKRPPLLPSEEDNNAPPRRSREVTSRYLSSSSLSSWSSNSTSTSSSSSSGRSTSSRRSQSPMVTRTQAVTPTPGRNVSTIKRSQSAERRRPATPVPAGTREISNAARLLMTSTRSLSVSFQGESFKLPISKAKPAPSPATAGGSTGSVRKGTPERRKATTLLKDQSENFRITDQHRWPGRSKATNPSILARSLDYGTDKLISSGSGGGRALQKPMINNIDKLKKGIRLRSDKINSELGSKIQHPDDTNLASVSTKSDAAVSDSDSVSSESTSSGSVAQVRGGPRGIVVPARFWQETTNRQRKVLESASVSPVSKNSTSKMMGPSKLIGSKNFLNGSPVSSSPRAVSTGVGISSPLRGSTRPASPSKVLSSSLNYPSPRGMPSPTRTRNVITNMLNNNASDTPSILSFTADMRRGKVAENRVVDAHELRLLYNRQLQWRFVNARAKAAFMLQTETAERSLYNAWVTSSKLRHSVRSKRSQLQLLRQNLNLYSILKGQVPHLESWELIDTDHFLSLTGAREALETSIVRLPLVDGARADIQSLNKAICSAADVMHGMASSIGSHRTTVEQVSLLTYELANITANERALIDRCRNVMSALTAWQVNDCSLKTHILQLQRESSSLASQV